MPAKAGNRDENTRSSGISNVMPVECGPSVHLATPSKELGEFARTALPASKLPLNVQNVGKDRLLRVRPRLLSQSLVLLPLHAQQFHFVRQNSDDLICRGCGHFGSRNIPPATLAARGNGKVGRNGLGLFIKQKVKIPATLENVTVANAGGWRLEHEIRGNQRVDCVDQLIVALGQRRRRKGGGVRRVTPKDKPTGAGQPT